MKSTLVRALHWIGCQAGIALLAAGSTQWAYASEEHPLEPSDRSSPRALLETLLESVDATWELCSAGKPGFEKPFPVACESLDLKEFPPLVAREVSAQMVLRLKEILDRIELPPPGKIPDARVVERSRTRLALPTEIHYSAREEARPEGA